MDQGEFKPMELCVTKKGTVSAKGESDGQRLYVDLKTIMIKAFLDVPKRRVVTYKDFDRTNNSVDNFIFVTKKQVMKRYSKNKSE